MRGNTIGNTYTGIAYLTSGGITAGSGTAAVAADPNVTTSPHSNARQLIFAGNQLLAVDDGGIYLCTNPSGVGETATANIPTWTSLIGNIAATEVYTAAIDSSNNQVIEAAQDNGIAVLNQGTATQVQDTDGSFVAVDNTNHIQYYEIGSFSSWTAIPDSTGTQYQPAATVNGATGSYKTLIDGFDNALYYNSAPYALNAVNPASILVGGSGPNNKKNTYGSVYYSTDQGNTFTSIGGLNSGKTGPKPITVTSTSGGTYTDNSKVTAIAFGATNAPNAAYLGLSDGDILYSSDVTQNRWRL